MIDKETVRELAQERIDELNNGCYLVDINISEANTIRVEADNINGAISIDSCVSISRNIEHNLDREEEDFALSVSSPGLDRPFKVIQQYEKNIGRQVKVINNEGEKLVGELKAVDESGVEVETRSKERLEGKKKKQLVVTSHQLAFENIKETKIVISFNK
jgi:ribosome maturation factor RimP